MKIGYKAQEIFGMTLNDIDLMLEAMDVDEPNEEELTTLDKAFPFLFA